MTDIVGLRKEAVENATKAVEADDKDNFEDACKYYIKAAEKLTYLSKIDENQYNKETYRKKAMEYCERARNLKESLHTKKEPQPITNE